MPNFGVPFSGGVLIQHEAMSSSSGDPSGTLVVRVDPDDIVLYANEAMAAYLRARKSDLAGAPLEVLADRTRGEIASCFQRPEGGRTSARLVTDADGRVFEVKTTSEGGVMDILLDEVTTAESVSRDLRLVSGTSVDLLNEEELRTARTPERRFMTISTARLNGVAHLADRLEPTEIRLMVNSFVEEVSDAVLETGCTAYPAAGESVVGVFGAPRYFADHALRAVLAACKQIEKTAKLRAGFSRQGKEMPPMSCGIWTGEAFVGTLGSSKTQRYSAIGRPVDLAAKLSTLARPGEVLVSEFTLESIRQCLPEGWQAIRAESQTDPDLGDFQWDGGLIGPLPNDRVRGVWLVGPGIEEDTTQTELYFDYLWTLKVPGIDEPVPILRVVRPTGFGDTLELSDDNVVSSHFVQTLGKYKLICVVGTGGMGKVWKGQDRYGNIVAIKVLHASETTSDAQLKRFRREAEIMARLPHRNICRVFEMNEFEGVQYLVMEFVDGLTLADLLYDPIPAAAGGGAIALPDLQSLIVALRSEKSTREGKADGSETGAAPRPRKTRILPTEQTLNVFLKVCDAVQFAHEHGVLHRDLKPGNILLREDGEPLVADFGLAKMESGDSAQSLSVSGHVVGTLENMAPEQAESSKDVDERADLYSLGTILYQMLTGRRHFEATGNIVADAQALQNHEPPRPRSFNPKLDTDLEIILLKCLRNSPAQRYRSVAALKADLQRYRRGEVITARPVSAIELARKLVLRNRAVSAVIAASLLVLVTGSAIAFWKIAERAQAAEVAADEARKQRALAVESAKVAKQRQAQAEEAAKLAMASEAKARKAEAEATAARKAAEAARGLTATARQETEEERKARLDAEAQIAKEQKLRDELRKQIEDLKGASRVVAELQGPVAPPTPELDNASGAQARRAMADAMRTFHVQLAPAELARYERNPEEVLRRLGEGLNSVSQSLLGDPTFTPAWILKGHYHLSCMEIDAAAEAFRMAAEAAGRRQAAGKRDVPAVDDPVALLEICSQLAQPSNDRFSKAADLLAARSSPSDQIAAGILNFLKDKSLARKSLIGSNPTGREASPAEGALRILVRNGGNGRIVFNDAGAGKDITIAGADNLGNLSELKLLAPTKVRIAGAETIDIASLSSLPLEALDLGGCQIAQLPASFRSFPRLKSLSLRDTKVADLSILRSMPALEKLNITGSAVVDLAPLVYTRRLESLEAGKLNLQNLRVLRELQLTRLTISPSIIADRAGITMLRHTGGLKVLRAPTDPENQTPADFWRKYDSGKYPPAN